MNIVTLMGRLTRDVELKTTPSGKNVCSFTIAVDRGKDQTDFINCVAWERTAEFVSQYFHRGSMIAVSGRIQCREYESNGQKRTAVEVVADRAYFCGKEQTSYTSQTPSESKPFTEVAEDIDLPF